MSNTLDQSNIIFFINRLSRFMSSQITNTRSFSSYFEPIISTLVKPNFRAGLTSSKLHSIEHIDNNLYTVTLKLESKKPMTLELMCLPHVSPQTCLQQVQANQTIRIFDRPRQALAQWNQSRSNDHQIVPTTTEYHGLAPYVPTKRIAFQSM